MHLKKWALAAAVCSSLLFTACGTDDASEEGMNMDTSKPVNFDIDFQTATPIKVGDKVDLLAYIHEGDKPIDDAEVAMEYWMGAKGEHQNVEAEHGDGGKYKVTERFTEPGTYHVTVHTTANDMHKMPTFDFEVVQ
ncbi:MAG TPA: FixH family protein [Bacilli bacterium]|nr:FixH family protein [Bacilli bacterium]